jgi:diguanylate cyclase (GGDEF)-like protein
MAKPSPRVTRGRDIPVAQLLASGVERFGRPAVRALPGLGALAMLLAMVQGKFALASHVSLAEVGSTLLLATGLGAVVHRRAKALWHGVALHLRDDVELGAVLIAGAYALVQLLGPAFYPVLYLLMAFLVAFLPRTPGLVLFGLALGFDGAACLGSPGHAGDFFAHAAFLSVFAGLYHLVLAAQVATGRVAQEAALKRRLTEVEERARAYRLVNAGGQEGEASPEEREKWMVAAVKEVDVAVSSALEVAEIALNTHTCAVFLLSVNERELKLHDCRSHSDSVRRDAIMAAEGLLASVIKRRAPMRLSGNLKGITYYDGGVSVGSILAVPLCEPSSDGTGLRVRGVLVADRLTPTPFTDADERLFTAVAGEVLRAIEVERVLGYIKKTRDEKDRFYRAIEELNRTAKPAEVFTVALDLARSLCKLDFVAFTLAEEEGGKKRHRVSRANGVSGAVALEGHVFADNNGLVANVVRYGAPLPGRDVRQMDAPLIFDEDAAVKGLAGLKIFPLKAGDRVLGTLVAGSRKRGVLDDDAVRLLEVLAIQTAQSVLRGQLFEQMERMATTDGLTGLTNHRTFQAKADEQLALSRRYNRKMTIILTDVDHFKSVNDTYGHPVGDQVLKGVAKILQETARDTDVVARYGGEEFALVMPETDAAGAKVIAERIREQIQSTVFDTELGPLKITLSLGVATFPESGAEKHVLVEKADQCLYFAKRHGRNQSVTVAEMEAGGKLRVVEKSA